MKEINISKTICAKRKLRGITQEELAEYMGVSKASVSKWETGQSYPDITFLPQLAAYFNISVDELIGYAPQLTKEQIRARSLEIAADFAHKPFEEVISKCRELSKEYHSCFELQLQIGLSFVNNAEFAPDRAAMLSEAVEIFDMVREQSDDAYIIRDAMGFKASTLMMMGKPQEIIDMYGGTYRPMAMEQEILAQAYLFLGNMPKAKEVTQICMYQHLLALVGLMPQCLMLTESEQAADEILRRTMEIESTFAMRKLHPYVMLQVFLTAAQKYMTLGNEQKALAQVKLYTEYCVTYACPMKLHGDDWFDDIQGWIDDFPLGSALPRSEEMVLKSMLSAIADNPAFAPLHDNPDFITCTKKLQAKI